MTLGEIVLRYLPTAANLNFQAADYAEFYPFGRVSQNIEGPGKLAIIRNVDATVKVYQIKFPMNQIRRFSLRNARFDLTVLISLE